MEARGTGVVNRAQTRSCRVWSTASLPFVKIRRLAHFGVSLRSMDRPTRHSHQGTPLLKVKGFQKGRPTRKPATRPLLIIRQAGFVRFPTGGGGGCDHPTEIPASHKHHEDGYWAGCERVGSLSAACRWFKSCCIPALVGGRGRALDGTRGGGWSHDLERRGAIGARCMCSAAAGRTGRAYAIVANRVHVRRAGRLRGLPPGGVSEPGRPD